jgi:hypothetical protein
MEKLSKKEILDELKRLGIDSSSEPKSYLTEYKKYSKSSDRPPAKNDGADIGEGPS